MKKFFTTPLMIAMLLSCGKEEHEKIKPLPAGAGTRTCCRAVPVDPACSTCGGIRTGTFQNDAQHQTSGQYYAYPTTTVPICPKAKSITITVEAQDIPNTFRFDFLDAVGSTISTFSTGWVGYADYPSTFWGSQLQVSNPIISPFANSVPDCASSQPGPYPTFNIPQVPQGAPPTTLNFSYTSDSPGTASSIDWTFTPSPTGSGSPTNSTGNTTMLTFNSQFVSGTLLASGTGSAPYLPCTNAIQFAVGPRAIQSVLITVTTLTPVPWHVPSSDYWRVVVSCSTPTLNTSCNTICN